MCAPAGANHCSHSLGRKRWLILALREITACPRRQVTLISQEFITQIAAHLGETDLDPARLRRNIVVSGLNLNALRRQQFWVGEALLEATQLCHPCARMEAELGPGGVIAMFGYGGLCAKIIRSGAIECGAPVRLAEA